VFLSAEIIPPARSEMKACRTNRIHGVGLPFLATTSPVKIALPLVLLVGKWVDAASPGEVVAWGASSDGQTSIPLGARSGVVAVAAGFSHPVALRSEGGIFAPPFDPIWTRPAVGRHTIAARAIDGAGASTVSVPVRITVLPAPDLPPVVALVAPAWTAVQEFLFTPPSSRISAPLSMEPGPVFYRVRER